MRISLELEPADIERLHAALARARRASACADEIDVIEAAKYALDHLNTAGSPAFVRKRVVEVQKLICMLEDEAWALSPEELARAIRTVAAGEPAFSAPVAAAVAEDLVRQRRRSNTLRCSNAKNDSIAALSPAAATRPIDPTRPAASRTARKARERNCPGSTGGCNTCLEEGT